MNNTFSSFADYGRLASILISLKNSDVASDIEELANSLVGAIKAGKRLIVFGNGGSAAEASHFAAELVSKCSTDHNPWPAISLSDSNPIITAIGNDYGFDKIFSRQLEAHLQEGDLVVGLSTSGKSPNVLNALNYSVGKGNSTYLLTGSRIEAAPIAGLKLVRAPIADTPRIQELHLIWIHFLSEFCEREILQAE
jgi:D-sedoheptulose 7-phosphate isomerase